jgi:hypothetical protein
MNMLVNIAKRYIPEYIKNKKLDDLFRLTATAFQTGIPELRGLPFQDRLAEYACFTKEQAEKHLNWDGADEERKRKIDAIEGKLYQGSFRLGEDLRKKLHIKTWEQAAEALQLIYRIIGIEFRCGARDGLQCTEPDGFTVSECFFSRYYSAEVCGLISSLDRGLAAGLTGCGGLSFTQRITEGYGCCKGYFGNGSQDL